MKVILTIVHDEDVENIDEYVNTFASDEGIVVVLEKTSALGCILQLQLSRILLLSMMLLRMMILLLLLMLTYLSKKRR